MKKNFIILAIVSISIISCTTQSMLPRYLVGETTGDNIILSKYNINPDRFFITSEMTKRDFDIISNFNYVFSPDMKLTSEEKSEQKIESIEERQERIKKDKRREENLIKENDKLKKIVENLKEMPMGVMEKPDGIISISGIDFEYKSRYKKVGKIRKDEKVIKSGMEYYRPVNSVYSLIDDIVKTAHSLKSSAIIDFNIHASEKDILVVDKFQKSHRISVPTYIVSGKMIKFK